MSVEIHNETEHECDLEQLGSLAAFLMDELYIHPDAELGVTLIDDEAMEQLHIDWLDLPDTTDVMSFPMDELRPGTPQRPTAPGVMGDIVISPTVAAKQAKAHGHSTQDEICLLLTHGFLHLLGFDHDEPEAKAEMFGLQRELLEKFLDRPAPKETETH